MYTHIVRFPNFALNVYTYSTLPKLLIYFALNVYTYSTLPKLLIYFALNVYTYSTLPKLLIYFAHPSRVVGQHACMPAHEGVVYGLRRVTLLRCSCPVHIGDLDIVTCTACNKQINPNTPGATKRHPVLKVLICKVLLATSVCTQTVLHRHIYVLQILNNNEKKMLTIYLGRLICFLHAYMDSLFTFAHKEKENAATWCVRCLRLRY